MAKDHALWMQATKITYLFLVSCTIKYANYLVSWKVKKASGKAGSSLIRRHFISEAISPVRSEKKVQEQKPTSPVYSEH